MQIWNRCFSKRDMGNTRVFQVIQIKAVFLYGPLHLVNMARIWV